ncbi:DUF4124 domain-containing protein [Roseateles sp. LYH14W]|uniref:DUF4124 domain-containing protein n=1 Tax=Pelomonas parva TaxID=3299032 RepID=A0ABW7EZK5_9BURK
MRTYCVVILIAAGLSGAANAQRLPATSRTVFKCEAAGKVVYSDEPCPAAKRLEIEPTRGLTTTGKEGKGADVRHEIHREQLAEAVRPITGMNATQYEVARKRVYLAPEVRRECARLDASMASSEARERAANGRELAEVQSDLLRQRNRFKELKC